MTKLSLEIGYENTATLFEAVMQISPIAMFIIDMQVAHFPFISVNPAFEHLTGYTVTEALGKNMSLLYGDDSEQFGLVKLRAAFHDVNQCEVVLRNYHKDGTQLLNHLQFSPVFDTADVPIYALGILRNINPTATVPPDIEESDNADLAEIIDEQEHSHLTYELVQEHNVLRTLINAVPDFLYAKDAESRFIFSNNSHLSSMGKGGLSEVFGKSDLDLFPSELANKFYADEQNLIKTGQPLLAIEESSLDVDGNLMWALTSKVPLKNEQGAVVGLIGVTHNITERKKAEDAIKVARDELEKRVYERTQELEQTNTELEQTNRKLKKQEHNLRLFSRAVKQSDNSIVITDMTGMIEYVNPKYNEKTGYTNEEVIGQYPSIISSGRTEKAVYTEMWDTILSGNVWYGEFLNKKKSGEEYWERAVITPIRNESGTFTHVLSIQEDVTENKQLIESLQYGQARLAEVQRIAHLGHWDWNIVTNDLYWSDEIYRIFGLEPQEFVGTYPAFMERIHPDDRDLVQTSVNQALEGLPYDIDHRIIQLDGTERIVHEEGEVLCDADGNPIRMLGIVQDITERKKREQAMQQLLNKLKRSNAELQEFAYITSHDLKAPLRAIGSLASWLISDYREQLDEQGQEYLDLLMGRAMRMETLISDILTYSRVERDIQSTSRVDLQQVVRSVINTLAPPPYIKIEIVQPLPSIHGEPTRLAQLFQNIISNAIKYMDKAEGLIAIDWSQKDTHWQFSITDNGIGIEERYFDKIFQVFQTLSPRDETESTGVGLAIVRKVVRLHEGEIWLKSQPGVGTTFYFTLAHSLKKMRKYTETTTDE